MSQSQLQSFLSRHEAGITWVGVLIGFAVWIFLLSQWVALAVAIKSAIEGNQ